MNFVTIDNIKDAEHNLTRQSLDILTQQNIKNVSETHRQYQLQYNEKYGSPKKYISSSRLRYHIKRHTREDYILRKLIDDYNMY